MTKITAGRDYLGNIAPKFAAINDDILFGQIWDDEILTPKTRSIITISGLMGAGILDESLRGHLETGKANGITKQEIAEIITHLGFYTGWPKAWAAFAMAAEIWKDDEKSDSLFGKGTLLNDPDHFKGRVYTQEIFGFDKPMISDNVTFEPGARNSWHIHQVGQTLFVTEGKGWYQEEGKPARALKAGDIVEIPGGVKHWHGAAKDSWFVHLAFEDPSKGAPEWCECVSDELYDALGE